MAMRTVLADIIITNNNTPQCLMQNPGICSAIGCIGRFYSGESSDYPPLRRCLSQFGFDTIRAPTVRKEWVAALRYAAKNKLRLKVPFSAGRPRMIRFYDVLTPRECARTASLIADHFGGSVAKVTAHRPKIDLSIEFLPGRRRPIAKNPLPQR